MKKQRRKEPPTAPRKPSRANTVLVLLGLIVVLAMVLGPLLSFASAESDPAQPLTETQAVPAG